MQKDKRRARAAELRKLIEYHSDLYYNRDDPQISDYEYDMLLRELRELEAGDPSLAAPDSPTAVVGGTGYEYLCAVPRVPMGSLQDFFLGRISPSTRVFGPWLPDRNMWWRRKSTGFPSDGI
jgi:DNA ligase (NAD+)